MFFNGNIKKVRAGGLWIAGALLLLAVLLARKTPTPPTEVLRIKVLLSEQERRVDFTRTAVFDAKAYYQPTIEYNLYTFLIEIVPIQKEYYVPFACSNNSANRSAKRRWLSSSGA